MRRWMNAKAPFAWRASRSPMRINVANCLAARQARPDLRDVPSEAACSLRSNGWSWPLTPFFGGSKQGSNQAIPALNRVSALIRSAFKQFQNSFAVIPGTKRHRGTLVLAKVGHVKMVLHRPITGKPKTAIVKRTRALANGRCVSVWSSRACACPSAQKPSGLMWASMRLPTSPPVRRLPILASFAERRQRWPVPRASSRASPTGSTQREKKRKVVARVHERNRNRRKNFIEREVVSLLKRFGRLSVEALVVRTLIKNPNLAKSIADASWSMFFTRLRG
jgi:putative transposase